MAWRRRPRLPPLSPARHAENPSGRRAGEAAIRTAAHHEGAGSRDRAEHVEAPGRRSGRQGGGGDGGRNPVHRPRRWGGPELVEPPKPRQKNDPKYVAAARELRDRYLEQINDTELGGLPAPNAEYDLSRRLADAPTRLIQTPLLKAV